MNPKPDDDNGSKTFYRITNAQIYELLQKLEERIRIIEDNQRFTRRILAGGLTLIGILTSTVIALEHVLHP